MASNQHRIEIQIFGPEGIVDRRTLLANQCGMFLVSSDGKPFATLLEIPEGQFDVAMKAATKAMQEVNAACLKAAAKPAKESKPTA